MGFYVVRKRTIILICVAVVVTVALICLICIPAGKASASYPLGLTVVIDAGHGGVDGGKSGVSTNVKESDINLAISKKLESFLNDYGIRTVMTRKTSEGLYGTTAKHFKIRDMKERERIIDSAKPDLVLSIHCNSFSSSRERGAQVFFANDSASGKSAAGIMQNYLKNNLPESSRPHLVGDYFILECSGYLSLIVECGFLSNAEDEALLITGDYQERVAYAIFLGALGILVA